MFTKGSKKTLIIFHQNANHASAEETHTLLSKTGGESVELSQFLYSNL